MLKTIILAATVSSFIQFNYVICDECPKGWVRVLNKCYYNLHILITREENRVFCERLDADMLTIENEFENAIVSAMNTRDFSYWLSGVREATQTVFKWDSNENVVFTKWAEGEPIALSDANSCVALTNGVWKVVPCDSRRNLFCQLTIDNKTLSQYPQCEDGWLRFCSKCYLIEKIETKLYDNEMSCRTKGATMVAVRSRLENAFLNVITERGKYYWLGGHRVNHGADVFQWFDNTRFDYKQWATRAHPPVFIDQPGPEENNTCIYDGFWHDCGYDWDFYYHLCEKDVNLTPHELNKKIDNVTKRLNDLKETVLQLGTLINALYKQISNN